MIGTASAARQRVQAADDQRDGDDVAVRPDLSIRAFSSLSATRKSPQKGTA
jgi:hypothetical protein